MKKNNTIVEKTKKYLSYFPDDEILKEEEQRKLIQDWLENKNKKSLDKLISTNRRMVVKQAYKYANYYTDIEDLIQCGMIGLIKSVDYFDLSKNIKFCTYATYWVKSELINHLKKETKHNFKRNNKDQQLLEIKNENPNNLLDYSISIEDDIIAENNKLKAIETIKNSFDCLNNKEKIIITDYYLQSTILNKSSCTKIAKKLNISKQRVATLIHEATEKLKREQNIIDFSRNET